MALYRYEGVLLKPLTNDPDCCCEEPCCCDGTEIEGATASFSGGSISTSFSLVSDGAVSGVSLSDSTISLPWTAFLGPATGTFTKVTLVCYEIGGTLPGIQFSGPSAPSVGACGWGLVFHDPVGILGNPITFSTSIASDPENCDPFELTGFFHDPDGVLGTPGATYTFTI